MLRSTFTKLTLVALFAAFYCELSQSEDAFISFASDRQVTGAIMLGRLDDQRCLSVGEDKVVRLLDFSNESIPHAFRFQTGVGQRGDLTTLATNPSMNQFAVGTFGEPGIWNPQIYVVDYEKKAILKTLSGHQKTVRGLQFIESGKRMLSTSDDKTLAIWDLSSGRRTDSIQLPGEGRAVVSVGNNRVVVAMADGRLVLVDLGVRNVVRIVNAHAKAIRGMIIVGDKIITGSADGTVKSWSKGLDQRLSVVFRNGNKTHPITSLSLARDKKRIIYSVGLYDEIEGLARGVRSKEAGWLDVDTLQTMNSFTGHELPVRGIFQFSDTQFAGLNEKSEVVIWDQTGKKKKALFAPIAKDKHSLRFSHDGGSQSKIIWASEYEENMLNTKYDNGFELNLLTDSAPANPSPSPELNPINRKIFTVKESYRDRAWQARGNIVRAGAVPDYLVVMSGKTQLNTFFLEPYSRFDRNKKAMFLDQRRVLIATKKGLFVFDSQSGQMTRELFDQGSFVQQISFPKNDSRVFLTHGVDNVTRIWNRGKTSLVFNLFIAGSEWVAWTKEGYYDCSPGGERLVGWQVNKGHGSLAEFQPLQNFHKKFHRPKIIRRLWQTADVAAAFSGSGESVRNAQDNLGPKVVVSTTDGTEKEGYIQVRSPELKLKVSAQARDGSGLTELAIHINGRHAETIRDYQNQRSETFTHSLKLTPGLQKISVLAKASNQTFNESDSIPVFYKTSSVKSASRKLFVLGVGISNYTDAQNFGRLPEAASLGKKVVSILEAGGKGLFDEGVEATFVEPKSRDDVFDAIAAVKKDFKPTDMFLLYWVGHGLDVRGQFFFVLPDAAKASIRQKGLSADDLSQELADLGGGKVFLLIDTCEAGKAMETIRDRVRENGRVDDFGIMTIAASNTYQVAKQGLFGKVLKEGLEGTPETIYLEPPRDRQIVVSQRLESFLLNEVRERSNKEQEPISNGFSTGSNYKITLAK